MDTPPKPVDQELGLLTKEDLTPRGWSKIVFLVLYSFIVGTAAVTVVNVSPFVKLVIAGGGMEWETGMDEKQKTEILCQFGSYGFTASYVLMAVFGLFSDYIPMTAAAAACVLCNLSCFVLCFFVQNTMAIKLGILIGMQTLTFCLIFIFQLPPMFAKQLNMINAWLSLCGDISNCLTTVALSVSKSYNIPVKSVVGAYVVLFALGGAATIYITPASWTPYISAQRVKNGEISYEQYAIQKDGVAGMKPKPVYNPETDSPYLAMTSVKKVMTTKHALLFLAWYLCHFLRGKKLMMPYIDLVMKEKGESLGISDEDVDAMYNLWQYMPSMIGWAPNLVFALLADLTNQVMSWWLLNAVCSLQFLVVLYMPWKFMYLGSVLCSVEQACMFSLVPVFFGKQFGSHNITKCMSSVYVVMAGFSFLIDATQNWMITSVFNGSYLSSVKISLIVTMISFVPITLLVIMPFPKPVGAAAEGGIIATKEGQE